MESAENLYQHHQLLLLQQQHQRQQQQQFVYSTLQSSSSSCPKLSTVHQYWNPSITSGGDEFSRYMNEILPNSREYFWPKNIDKTAMLEVDDNGAKPCEFGSYAHPFMPNKLLEFSDRNSSILNNNGFIKNGQEQDVIDLNQNLWISSSNPHADGPFKQNLHPAVFAGLAPSLPSYTLQNNTGDHQIHHNLLVSTCLHSSSTINLPLSSDNLINYRNFDDGDDGDECRPDDQPFEERLSWGYCNVQQSSDRPTNSSNKVKRFNNNVRFLVSKTSKAAFKKGEVWSTKHESSNPAMAAGSDHYKVPKKPRIAPQSSCPTLKVRKERLGDRISALHRMVSPFGKTDTASVLTEAIGYIQFLQDQIQTLSVPYLQLSLKSSYGTSSNRGEVLLSMKGRKDDEEEWKAQDLRSRGLCLVPLAFTSYVGFYT